MIREVEGGLRIAKRTVPVRVQLADQSSYEGRFYADVHRVDGTPADLLDRLDDCMEQYLPLATRDHHLLVRKSNLVTVQLPPGELDVPGVEGARALQVEVMLSSGMILGGTIRAVLPPAQSRVLDYLNRSAQRFIPLFRGADVTLINRDYIVGIKEVQDV